MEIKMKFYFVIFVLLFMPFASAVDNLNLHLSVDLNSWNSDFYVQTAASATSSFDGYDLEIPGHPSSGYVDLYSVVSSQNLLIDSYSRTTSPRTLNLKMYADSDYSGTLELSWSTGDLGDEYSATLTDFGTDNTYSTEVDSVDLSADNSYSVSNSGQYRYFQLEISHIYCGDSIISSGLGEQCEGSDLNDETCVSIGYTGGTLSCSSYCLFNVLNCEGETCGNGYCGTGETAANCPADCSTSTGTSPGGGGGAGSLGCVDECIENGVDKRCLNSLDYHFRGCIKAECWTWDAWQEASCSEKQICYKGTCLDRDFEIAQDLACSSLQFECGRHTIEGKDLNCGVCSDGLICMTGKCVTRDKRGEFEIGVIDEILLALDLRNLWRLLV